MIWHFLLSSKLWRCACTCLCSTNWHYQRYHLWNCRLRQFYILLPLMLPLMSHFALCKCCSIRRYPWPFSIHCWIYKIQRIADGLLCNFLHKLFVGIPICSGLVQPLDSARWVKYVTKFAKEILSRVQYGSYAPL